MDYQLRLNAPAKINLFLELKSKRPDGFHELETVMSCVSLYDQLFFLRRNDSEIRLQTLNHRNSEGLPPSKDNLVVRALKLLQSRCGSGFGMDVGLVKRIPIQAGLGGASSDAATAMAAANRLWDLGLGLDELAGLSAEIGSDVPFFVYGGIATCTGRGEIVQPAKSPNSYPILIAKPPIGLSTPEVFQQCQIPDVGLSSKNLLGALRTRNSAQLPKAMTNRLEPAASRLTHWVSRLQTAFDDVHCPAHQLSGSGSCYFGLFENWKLLRNARNRLLQKFPDVALYYCHMVGRLAQQFAGFCSAKNSHFA